MKQIIVALIIVVLWLTAGTLLLSYVVGGAEVFSATMAEFKTMWHAVIIVPTVLFLPAILFTKNNSHDKDKSI